jgi:hypothetical protein
VWNDKEVWRSKTSLNLSVNSKLNRIWNSPTLMTWASYSTRALSLFVVLPLILKQFEVAEVALWYLFASVIALQSIADLGFKSTFSRIISFAMGGAEGVGIYGGSEIPEQKIGIPNWSLIERIVSTMRMIYERLSIVLTVIMGVLGTWSLMIPVASLEQSSDAWMAWAVLLLVSGYRFYGTIYQNYLEGLNQIALVRRLEAITSVASIITSITVLILGGGLLELVIANQLWVVLVVLRNRYLSRYIVEGRFRMFKRLEFDKTLFRDIWSPAWRSGVSGLMSNGLTHLSGILFAQIGSVEMVSAYLLSLKIITQIREISMAPFYSKLPLMAKMRVEGRLDQLISIAQRGMRLSHLVFLSGVMSIYVWSKELLEAIGSNVFFVSNDFWLLLSFAFFIHRFGAMHMQVYLTTNHVISHIADGVSGFIFIVTSLILIETQGIYSIPYGMLAGYLGFYSWYAAMKSYHSLKMKPLTFDLWVACPAIIIFICFLLLK